MDQDLRALLAQKRYEGALDLLLAAYENKVFRLACSMLGNEAAAEETAQEVFLRVWKALPGFRGQSSVSTWIYAITRNLCLTVLRSRASKPVLSLDEPGVMAAAEAQQVSHQPRSREPDLDFLLAQLPEKHRQVVTLFYMEERSYDEVARLLDMPMGTVKTYLYRARKQLAAMAERANMETREG